MNSFVYFIGNDEFVKIGKANNPERRLKELQTANPQDINLIYCMPGNLALEDLLHSIFDQYRVRGEWFKHEGALFEFIEYLRITGAVFKIENSDVMPVTEVKEESIEQEKIELINTESVRRLGAVGYAVHNGHINKEKEEYWQLLHYLEFMETITEKSIDDLNYGFTKNDLIMILNRYHNLNVSIDKMDIILNDFYNWGFIHKCRNDKVRFKHELISGEKMEEYLQFNSYGGYLEHKKKRREIILNSRVLLDLIKSNGGNVQIVPLTTELITKHNFNKKSINESIKKLKEQGLIFEPKNGILKMV